jgi:hypothetical protein
MSGGFTVTPHVVAVTEECHFFHSRRIPNAAKNAENG